MNHLSINFCHEKWLLFLRGLQHSGLTFFRFHHRRWRGGHGGPFRCKTAAACGQQRQGDATFVFCWYEPALGHHLLSSGSQNYHHLEKLEQNVFKSWELYTKTWCYCKIFVGCKANASSKAVTYFIAADRKVWMLDVILNPHLVLQLPAVQHHAMEKSWYPARDICQ